VIIRLFQDVIHAGIGVFGLSVFALLAPPGRQSRISTVITVQTTISSNIIGLMVLLSDQVDS
jgi:hypothetical protein